MSRLAAALAAALILPGAAASGASGTVAGGAAAGAVVFRSDPVEAPARSASPPAALRLAIRQGVVQPRVSAAPMGAMLKLRLDDGESAEIAGYLGLSDRVFRKTFVQAGDAFDYLLTKPGVVVFENEWRPLERSWLYVTPHAEAAVADAAGRYELSGLSPGFHRVTAWSPEKGMREARVEVREGGRTIFDFDFSR